MLRTCPAARFASHVSPSRERREACFAKDDDGTKRIPRSEEDLRQDAAREVSGPTPEQGSSPGMADIIRDIQNDMMRSGLGSVLKEEEAREALTTVADALHGSTETLEAVLQDESIIPPERLMDWSMRLGIRLPDTATPLERSVAVQRALLHSEAHDAHEGIVRDLLDDPHVTAGILQDLEWKISQYDELMRIVPSAANSIPPEGIASLGSTAISINPPTEREPFDGVRPEHSAPLNRLQSDFRKFRTKLGQKGVGYEWLEEDSARLPAMPQDTYRQIDFSDVRQRYIRSLHERKELVGKLLKAQLELRIREHQRTLSRYANEVLFATSTPGVPKQKERVYWPDFSTNIAEFTIAVREKRLDALSATVKALDLGERSSTVIQQTLSELDEQQKLFDALESVGAEDFTDPIDAKKNILFAEEIADQRFFDQWVRDVAPQAREILNALPTWPEDARLFVREQGYAEMLESVLAFDEVKDAETADGRRTPRGFAEAVPVTVRQQEDIRMIVALLQYGDPQLLPHAAERLERSQEQRRDTIDTALAAENLERQRHDVEARLSVQLAHPVADELDVKAALQRHYGRIDNAVRHLRGRDDGSGRTTGPAAQELLADAEEILNVLETCALQLENVRVEELEDAEYKPIGGNSNGVYRASNRTCYINATKLRDRYPDTATRAYARERLLSHERGHAILHILQTTVCPGLLFDMRAALAESTAGAHPPTDEELVSIAERNNWGIGRRDYDRLFRSAHSQTGSEDMARKAAIRPFLDELVNKYVSWKAKGRPSVNQETWELFGALDARTPPQEKKEIPYYEALELFENDMEPSAVGDPRFQNHVVDAAPSGVRDVSDQVNRRTHRTDDEAEDASSPDAFPSGEPAAIDQDASNLEDAERSVSNPIKKIDETHRNVIAIKSFAKAYPEYQAQIDTILGEPNNLELRSQQVDDIYRKGYYFEKNGRKVQYPGAERDPAYLAKLDKIHAYSEEIKKLITSIDEEKSNLTDLPPQNVMGIKALWNSIRWLSVLDIIKIAQDTKEDYLDMWRRFQQRKTSDVEYALAQWIPDSVPYLGMFKHYFDRRANQAELDDVQKWQNAFQNKDYYQLRAGLQNTPNQDQLKAIMNLLAQSGHINWSDENLWASLSSFSKYTIPVEPCRRDNNLRDEYLQKLITDIWNDKDLYVTWKNQNDNAMSAQGQKTGSVACCRIARS